MHQAQERGTLTSGVGELLAYSGEEDEGEGVLVGKNLSKQRHKGKAVPRCNTWQISAFLLKMYLRTLPQGTAWGLK